MVDEIIINRRITNSPMSHEGRMRPRSVAQSWPTFVHSWLSTMQLPSPFCVDWVSDDFTFTFSSWVPRLRVSWAQYP